MSDNVETAAKVDNFAKAAKAAQIAQEASVTYFKDVTEGEDIDFNQDLDSLDLAMEREEIVVRFRNPNGGKDIVFLVRHLAPGEIGTIEGSLLSNRVLELFQGADNGKNKVSPAELNADASSQLAEKALQRMALIVMHGIIKPANITLDRILTWDPLYINKLYGVITGDRTAQTAVDIFSEMDNKAGE